MAVGKNILSYFSTHIMGTSRQAVTDYGFDDLRFRKAKLGAAYCGIDVSRFKGSYKVNHQALCKEFEWPKESKILLFVGRLNSNLNQKNPAFALDVAKFCIVKSPDIRLLMAGGGEEVRIELESKVNEWGLGEKIRLIGSRNDIPSLMSGSDILLFPSIAEGLGMVAVEAQATGLRVVASNAVPNECAAIPGMVKFVPLSVGEELWADEVLAFLRKPRPDPVKCNDEVINSPFSIENSAKKLLGLYSGNV